MGAPGSALPLEEMRGREAEGTGQHYLGDEARREREHGKVPVHGERGERSHGAGVDTRLSQPYPAACDGPPDDVNR